MSDENTDINELFSRDPLKLTDEDITKIILEFRKRRNLFNANPAAAAGAAPKKLTAKESAAASLKIDLDLGF
jgi:hypothetical protein